MNPTDGVISEAWEAFKAHWRHPVPIALVVYVAVGLISIVLVALLTWIGAILSFVIGLIAFCAGCARAGCGRHPRRSRRPLLGQTYERVRPQLPAIIVGGLLAGLDRSGARSFHRSGPHPAHLVDRDHPGDRPGGALCRRGLQPQPGAFVRGHGWNVFGVIVLTILS